MHTPPQGCCEEWESSSFSRGAASGGGAQAGVDRVCVLGRVVRAQATPQTFLQRFMEGPLPHITKLTDFSKTSFKK